ncbi:DUF120 domain-containing protein [Nanoarchaeota archaeon]
MSNTDFLLYLAGKTELFNNLSTSTGVIAGDLKSSQQTVSRKLIELEKSGLINRDTNPEGVDIKLTQKAITEIKNKYDILKVLFDQPKKCLKGKIQNGLGEGGYYISKYKTRIKKDLGITPFHGTLNIKTNSAEIKKFLIDQEKITIPSFKTKDRTYGRIDCHKVILNKTINCFLIIPERTNHPADVIEVIAESNLRNKLKLKENNEVMLSCQK